MFYCVLIYIKELHSLARHSNTFCIFRSRWFFSCVLKSSTHIYCHMDTTVQYGVKIMVTLFFRTWLSQKVWSQKNITLWQTKDCKVLSSMRSESASLCSSTLLTPISVHSHIIVKLEFSLSLNSHVACLYQCIHSAAAGWWTEATGLSITVSSKTYIYVIWKKAFVVWISNDFA